MNGLFEIPFGNDVIPLSEIERIEGKEAEWQGANRRRLFTRDGREFSLFDDTIDGLLRRPIQLIPAERGTKLCGVNLDWGEPSVDLKPVIAWALCLDGRVRPITAAQCDSDQPLMDGYVEMPDGVVRALGPSETGDFSSPEQLLAYHVEERRAQEATEPEARQP